jgi:predicted alpha/beta superfamily hydrolase
MTAQSPALQPATPPLFVSILNTEYFEIESAIVGARFAVWVTTPPGYGADPNRAYPAIYMPDGNLATALTAPINFLEDMIEPKLPYVQVSIGYTMNDMASIMILRNRDLLPPGEPINPATDIMIDQFVASGGMTAEQGAFMKSSLRNTRADAFLQFLTEELHPQIATKYKIDESACGLFGFSLGGLFATYVALKRHPLFTRIGAGSPGMLTAQSAIFQMLEDEIKAGADHSGRYFHMTANELEITKPGYFQIIGGNFARFVSTLGANPLKGLQFTSHVIPYETHSTGPTPAFSSFLRTLYSAK